MKDFETKGLGIIEYLLTRDLYSPTDIILLSCIFNLVKSRKTFKLNINIEEYELLSSLTGLSINTIRKKIHNYVNNKNTWLQKEDNNYVFRYELEKRLRNSRIAFFIPTEILLNKDLTVSERLVLAYVLSYNKRFNTCKVHSDIISNKLKISVTTVNRTLLKLNRLGLIKLEITDKKGYIIKKKEIKTDLEAIKNYYIESIERAKIKEVKEINAIEKADIKNAQDIKDIHYADIQEANIGTLNLMIDDFSDIDLSKASDSDLNKLYFNLKNKLELVKTYKNNRS